MPYYAINTISGKFGHWKDGERILPGVGARRVPKKVLDHWVETGNVQFVEDDPDPELEEEEEPDDGLEPETEDDGHPDELNPDPSTVTEANPSKRTPPAAPTPRARPTGRPVTPPKP